MSFLSNVPCNLIARQIIETMEQGRGMEKEERERSGAGLRRRNVRTHLQYISVNVEGTKVVLLVRHRHKVHNTHVQTHTVR